MPTYQYVCTACGEPLEAVQSFSDAALTECPVCQGRLRKVFSAVGVVFKGSGFYKNDSRGEKKAATPKADGDSGSSDKGGDKAAPAKEKAPAATSTPAPTPAKTPAAPAST